MGHVWSKTRSLGQILEKYCVHSVGQIFQSDYHENWSECLMKSRTSSKMGHVGSKTRSLGQILEKPCVCYRAHIFSLIGRKLGQNVCLDEISDEFENGACRVNN